MNKIYSQMGNFPLFLHKWVETRRKADWCPRREMKPLWARKVVF